MSDRVYRQQNISLREEDVTEWEALKANGWKPTEIWRLGVATARATGRELRPDKINENEVLTKTG